MSNKILLRQTSKYQPHSVKANQNHALSLMNSTQNTYLMTTKAIDRDIIRKKSLSVMCEKRLKARILQIIGNSDPDGLERKKDGHIGSQNGHKYSRSYMHYKVISRERMKDHITTRKDSLIKIRNICESKLISLACKESQSHKKRKYLNLDSAIQASPAVKIWTPKNSSDLPLLNRFKTEPRQAATKPIYTNCFEPW